MSRYPLAIWDPLSSRQTEPKLLTPNIGCVHTMAASLEGVRSLFKSGGYDGVESHFGLGGSGKLYQWQDTDYQADANYDGNPEVISVETADRGETFAEWTGSNVPAWTRAQVDVLVELFVWICDEHDIPPALIPNTKPGVRGLAYHRQGIDGNFTKPTYAYLGRVEGGVRWSESAGKVCPGDRRIKQFVELVVPAVRERLKDFDFVVIARKGERRKRERFERSGRAFLEFVDDHVERGWTVRTKRVDG